MKKELKINYYWNLGDYPDLDIETLERLNDEAKKRIFSQILDGYIEGELVYQDNDIEVYGWWFLY